MCNNMDQLTWYILCTPSGNTSISQPHTQATSKRKSVPHGMGMRFKVLAYESDHTIKCSLIRPSAALYPGCSSHKRPRYGTLCPFLRSLDVCLLGSPCTPRILHKENKQANGTVKTSQGFTHGQKLLNTKNQILWFSDVHIVSY